MGQGAWCRGCGELTAPRSRNDAWGLPDGRLGASRLRDDELTAGQVVEAAGEEHPGEGALGACAVRFASLDGAFERECHSLASGAGRSRRREHPGQDGGLYRPRQNRRGPGESRPLRRGAPGTPPQRPWGSSPRRSQSEPAVHRRAAEDPAALETPGGLGLAGRGAAALVEVRAVGAAGPVRPQSASYRHYSPAGGMTTRPGTLGGESPGQRGHP